MPPSTTSKNLGQVSAIRTSATPPTNKNMMWIDNSAVPYKKKFYDTVTQQWLEVVFIASPANVLKKFKCRVGGSTQLTSSDDGYIVTEPDSMIDLPTPTATNLGQMLTISNHNMVGLPTTFNIPIRWSNAFPTQTIIPYNMSWRIAVVEFTTGVFEWCVV